MRDTIQGLGWYVRRGLHHEAPGAFFTDTIGLPIYLKIPDPGVEGKGLQLIYRGGGAMEFELMTGPDPVHEPYTSPEQATIVPIFRSFDLDSVLTRIVDAGATVIADEDSPAGRTVYFVDPGGNINGVRAGAVGSDDPIDAAAEAEHANPTLLDGVPQMPAGVLDIGWIELRVADVEAETAFYSDVIGLDVLSTNPVRGSVLYLGDLGRLEIRPGGTTEEPITDRAHASDMWMLRVSDIDAVVADLDAAGVHWVNRPFPMLGGVLTYFCDPEGHIVGLQNQAPSERPQDVDAAHRRAAGTDKRVALSLDRS